MSRNSSSVTRNRGRGSGTHKSNHASARNNSSSGSSKNRQSSTFPSARPPALLLEEHEDVKSGIREILLRLEPLVKVSGGHAPLGSMMGYLEEIDDSNFEKYLLVKHIKSKLKSSLLGLVQSEVAMQCRDTQLTPEK